MLEGGLTVKVGAVLSIVIVDEALEADAGPVVLPVTELAFRRGVSVPSLQEVTEMVKDEPELADEAKEQFVAVPAFSKSELSRLVMDSFITNE